MALEDYRAVMERCSRCSYCKWIPFAHVKSWRFAKGCPSIEAGKFQSYSACGRLSVALSLIEGRCGYTDRLLDIVYKCQMCGLCDVACKVCRYDMEPLEAMRELRFKLVEDGQCLREHKGVLDSLKKESNMMMKPRSDRGRWAEGLSIGPSAGKGDRVIFHAGCKYSFENESRDVVRGAFMLLRDSGVNVITMGASENCCGGRAYDMGYKGEFSTCAERNIEAWTAAGAGTIVTPCADCYHAFKRLYPQIGSGFEVLHIVEFIGRLIKGGKLKLTKAIPMKLTYHDPCHLGRLGEPGMPWKGEEKKIRGQIITHEPRKTILRGAQGVYDLPRDILKSIPGIELVEMERKREYSWCCGAGAGVQEAYPEFSLWTAKERIDEAKETGAEAIVSACGWCEKNFSDAIRAGGEKMQTYDIVELVRQAI